ncbi:MAG: hypothetical protein JO276_01635 [Sphingomonadaceae bacterium]|nr:hypothetical protein [Sphingomonadaceae bacterium]
MLSKKLAAVAAVSMITASSAAVAQSAQPLSLSNSPSVERAAAGMQGQSNLDRRGYGIYIVGAVILGLIIYGIVKLVDKNNGPHSP